jgi:acylphosphatase
MYRMGGGDKSGQRTVRARIWVSGRVQGVGYRAFVYDVARHHGLSGGVRNLNDGRVEVDVEGERHTVEVFIERLKIGPRLSRVDDLELCWESPTGQQSGFHIWYA